MYQINEIDMSMVNKVSKKYDLDMDFAKLLVAKHFTDSQIYSLTHLDTVIKVPFDNLVNGEKAGTEIAEFSTNKKNLIYIFGDYDVDGITSIYILYSALCKVAKCKIKTYVPQRAEGYGLSMAWCKELIKFISKYENIMVITVDNGITKKAEVDFLKSHGIQVIITDHHIAQQDSIPDCLIVDPQLYDEDPNKHLAGCGVAFKVGYWVQRYFNKNAMEELFDMLAIGTICDMMPMTLENIAFCYYGLKMINSKSCHPGIQIMKNYDQKNTYSYKDIGFSVGSKINACGRLGHVELAKSLIFKDSLSDEDYEEVAMKVIKCNESRKNIVKDIVKKIDVSQNKHIYLVDSYIGVAGIIANDILKRTGEDTIVFVETDGVLKGSLRSNGDTNVIDTLSIIKQQVTSLEFGGHKSSAGLSINKEDYNIFSNAFEAFYKNLVRETTTENDVLIDFEIKPYEVDHRLNDIVSSLPYDNQLIKEPIFLISSKLTGYTPTNNNPNNAFLKIEGIHAKIWVENIMPKLSTSMINKNVDIICTLDRSFMEKNKVTIKVIDLFEVGKVAIKNRKLNKFKTNKLERVSMP